MDTPQLLDHVTASGFIINWAEFPHSLSFSGIYRYEPRFQADVGASNSSQTACHQRHPCTGSQGPSLTLLISTSPCRAPNCSNIGCETLPPASVSFSALAKFQVALLSTAQVHACLCLSCVRTLLPWYQQRLLLRGVPLGPLPAWQEVVTTDTSLKVWGGVWNHRAVQGNRGPELCSQHINL